MSQVICSSCFEVEDTTKRFIELPYVCALCEEDSALPCDATTYYIIEARSKSSKRFDDWFRSENDNTRGIFDDYSTALEAAEREQDGSSVEYRVVECRPEPTSCDAPYNSGVPCQSALDSVQEEQFDQFYTDEHEAHNSDVPDQFDADTELINGLMVENNILKMQLSQANLNIQIQGEIIADLENTVGAYRVIFRIPATKIHAVGD